MIGEVPRCRRAEPPKPVIELPPAPTVEEATGAATLLFEGVDGLEAITWLYRQLVRVFDVRNPGCLIPNPLFISYITEPGTFHRRDGGL